MAEANRTWISPDNLDQLFERAQDERWSDLVLLGPDYPLRQAPQNSPVRLKGASQVFQLDGTAEDLAERISRLTELRSLNLGGNNLGSGGAKVIGQSLKNLTSLNLWKNNIGPDGTEAIASLTNLNSLDLEDNNIGDDGARVIAQSLKDLTSLNLGHNNLGAGGAKAIAQSLKNLTSLYLWKNKIGPEGAKAIASLTNLESLHLWGNGIGTEGTEAITTLSSLSWLDLESNNIGDDDAKSIARSLVRLEWLKVGNNGIGPDGAGAIATLTGLHTLNLWANRIGDDGAGAIAALTGLHTLNLRSNWIGDDGAGSIATLTGLHTLDLRDNRIGPDSARAITALTGLHTLDIGVNKIGDDGARAIAALTGLHTLDLRGSDIGDDGARAIAALTGLHTLHIEVNNIGPDGARAIAALTGLHILHIGVNNIGDDGARAIAALTGLHTLHIGGNNIGDDGARAIAVLTGLHTLQIGINNIGDDGARAILDVWSKRAETEHLRLLDLRENGDLSALVPEEVLANPGDPNAILAAYRRLVGGDCTSINEAKLLVVGNEAVGKTSLLRFLINGKSRDPSQQKTSGIDQEKIEVERWSPEASGIRLNVWDFGGQEMMRGTHRFFLTARSLYLLVLEDRREDDRSIYEWLKIIKNRGADSPILVVINKSDEGKEALRLPEKKLQEEHPEIIGFLRTSCNDDEFSRGTIKALRDQIAETVTGDERLKHVRDQFPASYLKVKEAIADLAAKRAVLPMSEFERICAEGDEITEESERLSLLELLNRLGTIVVHGLESDQRLRPASITLLDPNWLTDAVYEILNRPEVRDQQGEFGKEQLAEWLDPKTYSEDHRDFVLDMMQDEEIGLCFRLPTIDRSEHRFLIPEALPPNPPQYEGIWPEDSLRFLYHYSYLPPGLIPRLIVQAHRNLTKQKTCWRAGALFTADGCNIMVEADIAATPKRIDIKVCGPRERQRSALAVILNELNHVHDLNPECGAKPRVPLPDDPEHDVSYDHLLKLEAKHGSTYELEPEGAVRETPYTVAELLNGVRHERPVDPHSASKAERFYQAEQINIIESSGQSVDNITQTSTQNNPEPSESSWLDTFNSWRFFSLAVAGIAVLLANVLYQADNPETRFLIAGSAALFVVVYLLFASFNPDLIYRRLMTLTIGVGLLANAGGSAFDAYIISEPATGWVRWAGTASLGFYIACAAIVVTLAVLEWQRMRKT